MCERGSRNGAKDHSTFIGDALRNRSHSRREPSVACFRKGAGIPVEPRNALEWKEIERLHSTHQRKQEVASIDCPPAAEGPISAAYLIVNNKESAARILPRPRGTTHFGKEIFNSRPISKTGFLRFLISSRCSDMAVTRMGMAIVESQLQVTMPASGAILPQL